ncbi:unnamed protein product [Orchesella dallaii]|uniref:RING-type E3 ubiquitin transferase n=1 Tax=Orchesella dallaii TaxID=48710 RepID=A0ABP1RRE8_9HEXA
MEDEFVDQLRCPICFEIPQKEVYQCRNGHTICSNCSKCMENCPQCRVPFGNENKIRVRALESLLDTMKFDCSNKEFGCKQKLKRKEMASHAELCIFKGKSFHFCKSIGHTLCNYSLNTLSLPAAIKHLQNEHGAILRTGDRVGIRLENFTEVISTYAEEKKSSLWTPIILKFEKDLGPSFIILNMINGEDNTLSWICILLEESCEEGNEFMVEYSIHSNDLKENQPELNCKIPVVALLQAESILKLRPFRIPILALAQNYTVNGSLNVEVSLVRRFTEQESPEVYDNLEPIPVFCTPIRSSVRNYASSRLEGHSNSGEVAVFHNVTCDVCRQKPITGIHYKCLQCLNYDLCKRCKDQGSHFHHVFAALTNPNQNSFITDLLRTRLEINNFNNISQSGISRRTTQRAISLSDCSPLPDGVTCNGCCVVPISGTRYKCLQCSDFNLCLPCMVHKIHSRHVLVMIQNLGHHDFVQRLTRIRSPIINGPDQIYGLGTSGSLPLTQNIAEPHQVSFLGAICDGCRTVRIVDTLYKCLQCNDYNLCATCGLRGTHSQHLFAVINSRAQLEFIKRSWSLTEF